MKLEKPNKASLKKALISMTDIDTDVVEIGCICFDITSAKYMEIYQDKEEEFILAHFNYDEIDSIELNHEASGEAFSAVITSGQDVLKLDTEIYR